MTTIGSEYWPKTPEGRVLCLVLSVYSIAMFGYITASLATFFIDRDAGDKRSEIAGEASIRALHDEIAALRRDVRTAVDLADDRPHAGPRRERQGAPNRRE